MADRVRRLLPALWAGWLLCVALLAAPAPFATLLPSDAARVVNRIFAHDAYAALVLGVAIVLLERREATRRAGDESQFGTGVALALSAIACTVAGYFALQPMMASARLGQGRLSFGQLHVIGVAFFAAKLACVLALAWRAAGAVRPSSSGSAASAAHA